MLDSLGFVHSDTEDLKASSQDFTNDFILPLAHAYSCNTLPRTPGGSMAAKPDSSEQKGRGMPSHSTALSSRPLKSSKREATMMGAATGASTRPLTDFFASTSSESRTELSPQKKRKIYPVVIQDGSTGQHTIAETLVMPKDVNPIPTAGKTHLSNAATMETHGQRSESSPANGPENIRVVYHKHNKGGTPWSCLICTLCVLQLSVTVLADPDFATILFRSNEPQHLACAACATPRGESTWSERVV